MKKLTNKEASAVVRVAKAKAVRSNTRVGQCIMNMLPMELYRRLTDTNDDFFYWEDSGEAIKKFWETCVANGETK